jgi:hypothetical protein
VFVFGGCVAGRGKAGSPTANDDHVVVGRHVEVGSVIKRI